MLGHGAELVLIDGAVDRRAASSPQVADGVIVATGAVLDRDIEEVVSYTKGAVELLRLPPVEDGCEPLELPARSALTSNSEQIAQLLDENPDARCLLVTGAVPERFLRGLLQPLRHRGRELVVVVSDPTKVFLAKRGPAWYRHQGVRLRALARTELEAITVNPVAPHSHRLDSAQLRGLLREAIPDVPIFDVLHPDYGVERPAIASSTVRSSR